MADGGGLLLGIDAGTSRLKALLLDRAGVEVAVVSVPTPFRAAGGGEGGIEMTVGDLRCALATLLGRIGGRLVDVRGVGIAGMAECGAALGRAGLARGPVVAWHDRRGAEVVARVAGAMGPALATRTGRRPQVVSAVAKLGWLVEHGAAPVERWLGVPELCLRRLTGAEATEPSLASRTGWYDVVERRPILEVLALVGVERRVLPPVLAAGTVMGRVGAAGAALGLPARTPVTLAGHDHLAAIVGAGAGPGDLVNSVGTAETVVRLPPGRVDLDAAVAAGVGVSVAPGGEGLALLGRGARAGVVLAAAAARLGSSPAELDALSRGAVPAPVGAWVDRLARGEAPPAPPGDPGAVWAGVLDSLSGATADAVDRVLRLSGPAERVLAVGGGATSDAWLAAKARRLPLPLFRVRAGEAVARGAAVTAGVAAGWWPSAAAAPAPALEAVPR